MNWKRVLIDVCTQRDYLDPGAVLQVANREPLLRNLRDIFRWVKSSNVPVVSVMESHRPAELTNGFPLHCIDGTRGQEKVPFTRLTPRIAVETDNYLSLPPGLHSRYRQLVFRKRSREILSNPKADRFFTQLDTDEFILVGVGLGRTIKPLALALKARHKLSITVITDACGYWSAAEGDLATRKLAAKGIKLITTAELTVPPPTLPTGPASSKRPVRHRHHPAKTTRKRSSRTDVAKG